jgi:hypothetical protein
MNLISLEGKTNFFEKRVGEYQRAGVMASLSKQQKSTSTSTSSSSSSVSSASMSFGSSSHDNNSHHHQRTISSLDIDNNDADF